MTQEPSLGDESPKKQTQVFYATFGEACDKNLMNQFNEQTKQEQTDRYGADLWLPDRRTVGGLGAGTGCVKAV